MKKILLAFSVVSILASCNQENKDSEIPCTCDEVVNMQVVIQGQPAPTFEIDVDYCDLNGSQWEQITQSQYDTLNVGDCL